MFLSALVRQLCQIVVNAKASGPIHVVLDRKQQHVHLPAHICNLVRGIMNCAVMARPSNVHVMSYMHTWPRHHTVYALARTWACVNHGPHTQRDGAMLISAGL